MRNLQNLIELIHTDIRYGAGDGAYGEPSLDGVSLGGGSYQTGAGFILFYGDYYSAWQEKFSYNTGQTF